MEKGATRLVFTIGKYAIKVPRIYSWRGFLRGLLANLQERLFRNLAPTLTAKIYYADIFGVVLIMEKAEYIPQHMFRDVSMFLDKCVEAGLPVDRKPGNVGLINGRYKLIDFGD